MINELDYCYEMGKDYAKNGANTTNCNFYLFSTQDKLKAWEKGKEEINKK